MNVSTDPETGHRSASLYFWTTGPAMVQIARDWVLEGRHEDALRWLVDSLDMNWDDAISILAGKNTLVGDSRKPEDGGDGGFELVPDEDSADYLIEVHRYYAGRYRHGEQWFRPYAYVSSYGEHDLLEGVHWKSQSGFDFRSLHYANNPNQDRVHVLSVPAKFRPADSYPYPEERAVLFEQVNPPPPWMPMWIGISPAKALMDWFSVEGNFLEERAHHLKYGDVSEREDRGPGGIGRAFKERVEGLRASQAERKAELLEREQEEEEREEAFQAHLVELRAEVLAQAPEVGFLTLNVTRPDDDKRPTAYQVPKAPFTHWSMGRTDAAHLVKLPWTPCAHEGMRLFGDDAYHSDWILGSEPQIPFDSWGKDDPMTDAAYDLRFQLQRELASFKAAVLCGTGFVSGKVLHPAPGETVPAGSIIVIPTAGPEYNTTALSVGETGAIITERGGILAHLSIVGRELNLRLLQVKKARELYPEGVEVYVNASEGMVEVSTINKPRF